jgi:hypothetical protein
MTSEERWRRRPDVEVLDAGARLHEYTEEGRTIVLAELRRRGLAEPHPELDSAFVADPDNRCHRCNVRVGDGHRFCAECGAPLALGGTAVDAPRRAAGPAIDRTNVVLMIGLTIVTFGFYYPYWFLSRRPMLNMLRSSEQITVIPFALAILLLLANLLLAAQTQEAAAAAPGWSGGSGAAVLATGVELSFGVLLLVQCFKVRRMLAAHLASAPGAESPAQTSVEAWVQSISVLGVFVLGIFYLQHVINTRLPNERRCLVPD